MSDTTGTASSNVDVWADPNGLAVGNYTGTVTVTTSDASNSPQTINVSLSVFAAAFDLSGIITYGTTPINQSAKFVSGVSLNASGSSTQSASSDNSGNYLLSGLTGGGNYTVTPVKSDDANGITSFDATQVLRYVAAGGGTLTTKPANCSRHKWQ